MSASFHMVMDVASNKPVAETVTILRKNYTILEHYTTTTKDYIKDLQTIYTHPINN